MFGWKLFLPPAINNGPQPLVRARYASFNRLHRNAELLCHLGIGKARHLVFDALTFTFWKRVCPAQNLIGQIFFFELFLGPGFISDGKPAEVDFQLLLPLE